MPNPASSSNDSFLPAINLAEPERVASLIGGVAAAAFGVARRSGITPFLLLAGGYLIHRGLTGHCSVYHKLSLNTAKAVSGVEDQAGVKVEKTIEVGRPPSQVYGYWRRLSNLPKFMPHLVSIREIDARHSRWMVSGPAGHRVEWTAEIINEHPASLLAWKTLPGSEVQSAGSVRFEPMNEGARTKVTVLLEYRAPLGQFGDFIARLFGSDPNRQLSTDLARFKELVETDSDAEVLATV